jgi:hypothetical protein
MLILPRLSLSWPGAAALAAMILMTPPNVARAATPVSQLSEFDRAIPGRPLHPRTGTHLFAARGEFQAFQIAMPAPPAGFQLLDATCSDLMSDGHRSIARTNVTIYREHYVYVDSASPDWRGPNRSQGPGWYPDPLIPFRNAETGKPLAGVYRASPFRVSGSEILTLWVDVFVPRGTAPGDYHAVLTLSSDTGKVEIPWNLTVWNFELPLKPSLRSSFTFWNPAGKDAIEELLRHRLMPLRIPEAASSERQWQSSLGLSMTGTGFWSGADNSNCTMQPAPSVKTLLASVAAHDSGLYLFNYTADEVGNCRNLYPAIQAWARNLHEAHIRNLVVIAPTPQLYDDGGGTGRSAVDIWVVLPMQFPAATTQLAAIRAHGGELWSYNAAVQDPYSPKWLIDYDPIGYRLQAGFLSQSLGLTGLLYWRIDRWDGDVWKNVNNKGVFSAGNYPGEGLLLYPGGPAGVPGVVPSLRLKQLREGVQDYEYVEILKHLGRGDWALQQVRSIASDWTHWTRSGDDLEAVRQRLGAEINRLSTPTR